MAFIAPAACHTLRAGLCIWLAACATLLCATAHASAAEGAVAQFELGKRHATGQGVPLNRDEAVRLYGAAAQAGHAEAAYELARFYSGLTGSGQDQHKAHTYLRAAAQNGHLAAQTDLAFLYFNGNQAVPRDMASSIRWFKKAAAGGAINAQCMLGDFYRNGVGGAKQNHGEAFKWYQRTATKEDRCAPKSQFELYRSYESGLGVKRDLQAAMYWLRKAAESGNPQAQRTLGLSYRKGYGVDNDPDLARWWLRKSREGVAPHDDAHDHEGPSFAGPVLTEKLSSFVRPNAPLRSRP